MGLCSTFAIVVEIVVGPIEHLLGPERKRMCNSTEREKKS